MEREFKVGDKVRVVKATLAIPEDFVGVIGVVVGYEKSGSVRVDTPCRTPGCNCGELMQLIHEPDALELIESEQPMAEQKLNSQYLMHVAEVLTQAERAIRSKGNKYILNNPVEFYKWHQMYELCSTLEVKMRCRAEELEAQEAAQLSKAVTA